MKNSLTPIPQSTKELSGPLPFTTPLFPFSDFILRGENAQQWSTGMDLGCGCGSLSKLLLAATDQLKLTGIDTSAAALGQADQLVSPRFRPKNGDVCEIQSDFPAASYDLVVSNPPFYPLGRFRLPKNQERAQAMHEVTARLEDFIRAINWLLKPSGSAYLLQLAERTGEITDWLSSFKLVVTRLSFIYTEKASIARLVMVEIRRKPRSQTTVEAPLFFADGHVKEFIK